MNELSIDGFRAAILKLHGVDSRIVSQVRIDEELEGGPIWQGEVLVFELLGQPQAKCCYAWEGKGQVTAVLCVPPVDSALKAVQASFWQWRNQ